MATSFFPEKFELFNDILEKKISIVIKIKDVPYLISNRNVYSVIRYGDPDLDYGDPGIVYGGLRRRGDVKDILSLEKSSLNISQKVEPERGKGSVTIMSIGMIDKDQWVTQLCSPDVIVPEILGREIEIFLGYEEISYPEDFLRIFRGYISGISYDGGLYTFQLSDPFLKIRQKVFFQAKTKLTSPINNSTTTIPVASNSDFHKAILGPDGSYDPAINFFIKIDNEIIEYFPTSMASPTSFTGVARGQRNTDAEPHDVDSDVTAYIEIEDHAIDMTLKVLLSGWNGYFSSGVSIRGINQSGDVSIGVIQNAIFGTDDVDWIRDYGLAIGDYVLISGGLNSGAYRRITEFQDLFDQPNRTMIVDGANLIDENPSLATLSFRSQYDSYPITCGIKMLPKDVDVSRFQEIKNVFLGGSDNTFNFFITGEQQGKEWLESKVYSALGAYSVTQYGRVGIAITNPPLAGGKLPILNPDNVISPENIRPFRAINNRNFYNQINFDFDYDDNGAPLSRSKFLDSDSLSLIGVSSVLPIQAEGARTLLGANNLFNRRARQLLLRYKRGALRIQVKTFYGVGVQIEIGDVVLLRDLGVLQIPNWNTGERNLGDQLFEVIERELNIGSGEASLTLIGGAGFAASDRYATISPSSLVDSQPSLNELKIKPSFSQFFGASEWKKWKEFIGMDLVVHNKDYSISATNRFIGFDVIDQNVLVFANNFGVIPSNYIIDIPSYPVSADPQVEQLYKVLHVHMSPSVLVTGVVSTTVFSVNSLDIDKFVVGNFIYIRSGTYAFKSNEVKVTVVDSGLNRVTVDTALTYLNTNDYVELVGFKDGGQAYRYV